MRWLLSLLSLPVLAAAPSPPTNIDFDASVCYASSVNVTTGAYFESHQDLVIKGAEPIAIYRVHISSDVGNWRFHDERIHAFAGYNESGIWKHKIYLQEGSGGVYEFDPKVRCGYHGKDLWHWVASPIIKKDYSNTSKGQMGGKTHVGNYRLSFDRGKYQFTLITGSGEKRIYVLLSGKSLESECLRSEEKRGTSLEFVLKEVVKPNGNQLVYTYDSAKRLTKIESLNPSRERVLAWAQFAYLRAGYSEVSEITTSDHQKVEYLYEERYGRGSQPHRRPLLISVLINGAEAHYYDHDQHRISRHSKPSGEYVRTEYLHNGPQTIKKQHSEAFQVASQSAPIGPGGRVGALARYSYDPPNDSGSDGLTEVYDANGNRSCYHYNYLGKAYLVERFQNVKQGPQQRVGFEGFHWSDSLLEGHFKCDDNGDTPLYTSFTYDANRNVIAQREQGRLTGEGDFVYNIAPFYYTYSRSPDRAYRNYRLEPRAKGSFDTYEITRTYSEDGFNNLLTEDDGRIVTKFSYLEGTDLIATKTIYDGDQFCLQESFEYDENWMLSSYKRFDGFRTFTKILTARTEEPGFGLPEFIEEFAGEQLIKREHLFYSQRCEVIRKEVYDAEEICRYTLLFDYDAQGRLICSVDSEGHEVTRTYNASGQLIEKTTPLTATTITYDRAGRPIQSRTQDQLGYSKTVNLRYDLAGHLIARTDPFGNTTSFIVDREGRPVETRYPSLLINGEEVVPSTRATYDAWGNVTSKTDEQGNMTAYTYNGRNQVTKVIYPDRSCEIYRYFPNGQLRSSVDRSGLQTTYTRDYCGRPLMIAVYDSTGELLKETRHSYEGDCLVSTRHPDGTTTRYFYNALAQLTEEDHEGSRTTCTYDSLGRLSEKSLWDGEGETTLRYDYDLLDRRIREETYANRRLLQWKAWKYDFEGRKILESDGGADTSTSYSLYGPVSITDPNGYQTITTYTISRCEKGKGQQALTTDPLGNQTLTLYNTRGNVHSVQQRDTTGNTVAFRQIAYDLTCNPIADCHTVFPTGVTYTIQRSYDAMGRLLSLTELGGERVRTTHYSYDQAGRLATTTRPSGQTLIRTYDALGRLAIHRGPDFCDAYCYDLADRLLSVTSQDGRTTSRTYDLRGYLLSETLATGHTLAYQRDFQGKARTVTLPDNSTFHYRFTGPHLTQMTRGAYTFTCSYTLSGHLTTLDSPAGRLSITHDPAHRPILLQSSTFGQKLTYDAVGNLIRDESTDSHGARTTDYFYNALYQLISEEGPAPHTYACDSLGNRLSADSNLFAYDRLNQLLSVGETPFAYDEDGQTLNEGEWSYTYDSQGRLISAQSPRHQLLYTYDPFHRRLSKTHLSAENPNPTTEEYLYLDHEEIGAVDQHGQLLQCRLPGPPITAHIPSSPLIELQQTTYFPIQDYRGSVVVLLNSWGFASETYHYSAFGEGEIISYWGFQNSTSSNPYRFLARRSDSETGLIFFGCRYYCPHLGRWLTPDPKGFDDGPNLYTYCHSNPLVLVDPQGLLSKELLESFFGESCASILTAKESLRSDRISPYKTDESNFEKAISYSPNVWSDVKILDLGRKPLPNGTSIHFQPGINTSEQRARDVMETLSDICDGYNVMCVFQPSLGLPADMARVHLCMNEGLAPPVTTKFLETVREDWEQSLQVGGIFSIGHSGGTTTMRNANMLMSKEERDRFHPTLIANSAYMWKELNPNAKHYASKRDFVPLLDVHGRSRCTETTTWLTPHPNAKAWDHEIDSPTYRDPIQRDFKRYMDYQGMCYKERFGDD